MNSDDCPTVLACCGSRSKDGCGSPDVHVHECWSGRQYYDQDLVTLEPLLPPPYEADGDDDTSECRQLPGRQVPGPLALQSVMNFVNAREDYWSEWLQAEEGVDAERRQSRSSACPQKRLSGASSHGQLNSWRSTEISSPPTLRYRSSPSVGESRASPVQMMTPVSMATDMTRNSWSDASPKLPESRVNLMTPVSMETLLSSKQHAGRSPAFGSGGDPRTHYTDLLTPVSMATVVDRETSFEVPVHTAARSVMEVHTPASVNTETMSMNGANSEASLHGFGPTSPVPIKRLFR
uniref:Uncharacterized protein n=1 Tax=Alexandrium catenella TaxID=2925 RepID=A0A7S1QQS4_ALECA